MYDPAAGRYDDGVLEDERICESCGRVFIQYGVGRRKKYCRRSCGQWLRRSTKEAEMYCQCGTCYEELPPGLHRNRRYLNHDHFLAHRRLKYAQKMDAARNDHEHKN